MSVDGTRQTDASYSGALLMQQVEQKKESELDIKRRTMKTAETPLSDSARFDLENELQAQREIAATATRPELLVKQKKREDATARETPAQRIRAAQERIKIYKRDNDFFNLSPLFMESNSRMAQQREREIAAMEFALATLLEQSRTATSATETDLLSQQRRITAAGEAPDFVVKIER